MSVIATVEIVHDDLALAPTIRSVPEVDVRVVPNSGTDPETGMFFFMLEGDDETLATFERALESDHTVVEWTPVSENDTTSIYRLQHTDETKLITPETVRLGGLMLEARSTARGWRVQLQVPDREALAALHDYCEREGITIDLIRLYRQDRGRQREIPEVTEEQRVALVTAYEQGYFEEPRDTSLEELADILGISPTAMGGRIRRGTGALVEHVLVDR